LLLTLSDRWYSTLVTPMPILVTGAAGYVGSHCCKALAAKSFDPVAYDDLRTGHASLVRWGPLVQADIADEDHLRRTLRDHRIDAILHFAASAYVGESVEHPRRYFHNNVIGSIRLLDAAVDAGIRHFIFSSSCATYGIPKTVPITEDTPQAPVNPYGESKLFVERAMAAYERAYGLQWIALRYFNAAGADADGETGELHDPETHLIPLAIASALGQRDALEIFGTDYPTPDGTAIRDYIHVTDLATAHVAALQHLRSGASSGAFNLGTGRGYSVREVIDAVSRATGRPVPVREAPRRAGDPPALVADAKLAKRVLAWKPIHSDLDNIVATAHRWHAMHAGRPPP
jgi:UDP-glucose-4-epimerase GalE